MRRSSEVAQRIIDVCVEAKVRGDIGWEELNWVHAKAWEQFLADAHEDRKEDRKARRSRLFHRRS